MGDMTRSTCHGHWTGVCRDEKWVFGSDRDFCVADRPGDTALHPSVPDLDEEGNQE